MFRANNKFMILNLVSIGPGILIVFLRVFAFCDVCCIALQFFIVWTVCISMLFALLVHLLSCCSMLLYFSCFCLHCFVFLLHVWMLVIRISIFVYVLICVLRFCAFGVFCYILCFLTQKGSSGSRNLGVSSRHFIFRTSTLVLFFPDVLGSAQFCNRFLLLERIQCWPLLRWKLRKMIGVKA